MKRRFWAIVISAAVLLFIAYNPVSQLQIKLIKADTPETQRQIAYAQKHYSSPNADEYGDLGQVDCANFTSQTLIARGWKMTSEWFNKPGKENRNFSRSWISSTALSEYIAKHHLAKALTWKDRDQVQVGDIVQFDWDNSGDRDHTAIISGIVLVGKNRELLLAQHSFGAFNFPMSAVLATHPKETKVYFWKINQSQMAETRGFEPPKGF